MILFRYLSIQILQVMSSVTLILLIISFSSRFLRYLVDAVAGQMTIDILLLLMLSRLPEFLVVIIPLSFFLAVLLSYGRMHADNEMTVLSACGFSRRRLLGFTVSCSALVMALVAVLSLYVSPYGLQSAERLQQMQEELTELDLIAPGQFQAFDQGRRTTYADSIVDTDIGRQLNNTFVALQEPSWSSAQPGLRIMVAETGRPELDEETGRRYMVLEDGHYYDGIPGEADFQLTAFEAHGILLPEQVSFSPVLEEQAIPTSRLFGSMEAAQQAELQWRLSVIIMVPILALMSVPLSRVGPGKGRFNKLLPATLLFAVYYLLLELVRERMDNGELAVWPGMWLIHAGFLMLALMLLRPPAFLQNTPGFRTTGV